MPTFRSAPSSDLGSAIRRAMASSNLGPMAEMQADMAAANTAKNLGLAEKARAEVEAMQRAEADRANPQLATEYAGNAAGMNMSDATRLSNHLRGVLEQPGPGDQADAMMVGKDAQPYVTGAPNVSEGQRRGFQTALASLIANRLATGKTNADQLAQGGAVLNKTALANEASDATDVPTENRLVAAMAGKIREPFKTNAQGTVLNEETGALHEGTQLAGAVRNHLGAQAAKERAQAATAASGGKPPAGYSWGPKDAEGNATLVPIKGGPKDTDSGALTTDAIEMAADRYRIDGTLPPNLGRGTQGAKNSALILGRAAEKAKESGDDGEAARLRQVANKASSTALAQLSKQEAMVGAFEKNFNKNADLAVAQSDKVDRTGVPALNRWILAGKKNIGGDPDVAVLDVAMKAVINEYTKIISGSMGNAAMAEGEIKKVTDLLNSAHTPEQVRGVIAFMKKETGNRMTSFADQKAELTKGMRSAAPAPAATGDIEKRFSADPSVKGMKLGTVKDGKAEVLDASGKLVGYYE
jgi:hypothetical protein